MNIIRSKVIELNEIPAIAYKIKLKSGGSGIKMHRTDCNDTAYAEIDKRTGGAVIDGRVDLNLFPETAFDEAIEQLEGLPYSGRGKVKIFVSDEADAEEVESPDEPDDTQTDPKYKLAQVVFSDEFKAITDRFADENGKINYQLMNKQFIQFAAGSKTVSDMCAKKESADAVLLFVIKNRAAFLAGKRENLSDGDAAALIETIDEINPRSAFKELKLYIRKRLSK